MYIDFLLGKYVIKHGKITANHKEQTSQVNDFSISYVWSKGFPGGSVVQNPPANAGDTLSIPGSRRFPWRRKWQSTPVFLPGKFHGQNSLAGYSPPGKKRVGHDLATIATATAMYGVV